MNVDSVTLAPCGVVCELCIAFQRSKNRCVGCLSDGNKPRHCLICSIKHCPEKRSGQQLCIDCEKYPCRRIRDLEKRYTSRYGESLAENMRIASEQGFEQLKVFIREKWTCTQCGHFLSVHRDTCVVCGATNINYPVERH